MGTVEENAASPAAPPSDRELRRRAEALGEALRRRGASVSSAESCTGGWIAKVFTDVQGSSAWFEASIVTYSNAAKHALLGVPAETLEAHGAVSREVVQAMVAGVLRRTGADLAVAVSGIAGPGGGSLEKPVGLVWIAWGGGPAPMETEAAHFPGNRESVRRHTVARALDGLLLRSGP